MRRGLLLCLLGTEVLLLTGWRRWEPRAEVGYLVKLGSRYLVAYRDQNRAMRVSEHASLESALAYSEQSLGLLRGVSATSLDDLEFTWTSKRASGFVVYWKLAYFEPLNRLTFPTERDAQYFYDAFRNGAYSRSPFGHAVLLVPSATPQQRL